MRRQKRSPEASCLFAYIMHELAKKDLYINSGTFDLCEINHVSFM
jgi:hypothetical protein